MFLTDLAARQAKATGKDYTLSDGDGLSLFVTANGGKSWYLRFTWMSKQARISLGIYPEISLKQARDQRIEAHSLVARSVDPRVYRRQARPIGCLRGSEDLPGGV